MGHPSNCGRHFRRQRHCDVFSSSPAQDLSQTRVLPVCVLRFMIMQQSMLSPTPILRLFSDNGNLLSQNYNLEAFL